MKNRNITIACALAVTRRAALFVALALCASCSSGGGGGGTSFNGFVQNVVADTSDTSEPVDVNGASFSFSEDPNAFDNLFQ